MSTISSWMHNGQTFGLKMDWVSIKITWILNDKVLLSRVLLSFFIIHIYFYFSVCRKKPLFSIMICWKCKKSWESCKKNSKLAKGMSDILLPELLKQSYFQDLKPSSNTQSCNTWLLLVWDSTFWVVWAARSLIDTFNFTNVSYFWFFFSIHIFMAKANMYIHSTRNGILLPKLFWPTVRKIYSFCTL